MDIKQVVERLSDMGFFRIKKVTGDWYTIYCPFHKDGNERKPSCGISLKDNVSDGKVRRAGHLNCLTCHESMPLSVAVKRLSDKVSLSEPEWEWIKENVPGFDENAEYESDDLVPSSMVKSLQSKYALNYLYSLSSSNKTQEYVSEEELEGYRFTVPYMYERGLTDEIIERYDIGFDANHVPYNRKKPVPCVTFPVRDRKGRCLFIFRRSVEGRYFNYPTGVEKPLYGLYELNPKAQTVVVCESAFNMMTCVRHGYDCVALFGTGNSLQVRQLMELGVKRFVLALDPDDAGEHATEKLRKKLCKVAFVSVMKGFPDGKDLNDLTEEEFSNLYIE